jgi:hypothetical protein
VVDVYVTVMPTLVTSQILRNLKNSIASVNITLTVPNVKFVRRVSFKKHGSLQQLTIPIFANRATVWVTQMNVSMIPKWTRRSCRWTSMEIGMEEESV